MTRDKDSVFTLDNTKLVSTTATNGNDEGNYNAGTLNIINGSSITYTAPFINENGGTITVIDSVLNVGSIVNNGTINLTVTDAKLAGIMGETYTIINQTGNGAALDLKVNYNGTAYGVGETFTVDGIKYDVVNGDGNDIAIEAFASVLTVDPSYIRGGSDEVKTEQSAASFWFSGGNN